MTVIHPNSISGIASVTSQSNSLYFYESDQSTKLTINAHVNGNVTGTNGTFSGDVSVGGVLTYEDVTNIDSVGVVTARSGVNITGGDLTLPDAIIHTGDTNTRIRFPASDTFSVETAGNERLRITSAGLVGINSISPATALDIQSTKNTDGLTITKAGTRSAFLGHNGSGNEGLLILRENGINKIQLYAESGQPSFINSGNFGIGIVAPTGNLEVNGNDGINISNATRTGTNGVQWRLIPHNGGGSATNLRLYEGAGATEVLNITKTGRIGVNRTTPSFMLDIIGNSSTGANCIRIVDGAETGHGSHPAKIVAGGTYYHEMQMHSRRFTVHTWNGSNIAERFRVNQDGTVTTGGLSSTPGTVAAGSFVQAAANAGFFSNGIDGKFGTSSNHPLYLQVNGVTKATVTAGGAFSVGTTSPQQPNVPSMHLHSTANDDARIAITTPSKPNSRIGYFGLSNKFGMDVHNGFEVRDASASYATRLAVDSLGRVTTPAQPSFGCIKNGHQYPTSGQRVVIAPWTEHFDQGSNFNATTGVFTAPVAGKYFFYISVMLDNNDNGDYQIAIFRNGSLYYNTNDMVSNTTTTFLQTTVNGIVEMSANDTVDFRMYNSTSTSSYIYQNHYTHCGGYLIG